MLVADRSRADARVASSSPSANAAYAAHTPAGPILCSNPGLSRRGTT